MHDCRKFREQVIEQTIGPSAGFCAGELEFDSCVDCQRFIQETLTVNRAISAIDGMGPTRQTSEEIWDRFEKRLQLRLADEPAPRRLMWARFTGWMYERDWAPGDWRFFVRPRWLVCGAAVAAVFAMITWRLAIPANPSLPADVATAAPLPIDPQTVEFLGRSEMFLRDFSKIQPSNEADLEDARDRARMQLAAIAQRKAAVATVTPVWIALGEYETVLREIKNLDEGSGQDVEDIQSRIARQGLIAAMKVYQPRDRQDREN